MDESPAIPELPQTPPRIYRAMQRDADGLPVVGSGSSSKLGARLGVDVRVDAAGNVMPDGGGMSVTPRWCDLDYRRIPRRLRNLCPGASGNNSHACFTMGSGPFQRGSVAKGLELIPDYGQASVRHGVVAAAESVSFSEYQAWLEVTRDQWRVDEQ